MYAHLDGFAKKIKRFWLLQRSKVLGWEINFIFSNLSFCQRVSCEGVCARAMCGHSCACKIHYEKCVRCACMRLIFRRATAVHCHKSYIRRAICDRTFWNKTAKNALFFLKTTLERPYPVLEHPFLLWYILSCFRRSYSVSEQKKMLKNC